MPIVIDIKCDLVLSQHDTQSLQQSVQSDSPNSNIRACLEPRDADWEGEECESESVGRRAMYAAKTESHPAWVKWLRMANK